MALISKEIELQEGLSAVFEKLVLKKNSVKKELTHVRAEFNLACDEHIKNGFNSDQKWTKANKSHQHKYIEYEMYCHMVDILNDFKDIYDQFPEYIEMYQTLNDIMIRLAEEEKYELAAITKLWVDKIEDTILRHVYY